MLFSRSLPTAVGALVFSLALAACHHAPRNVTELRMQLPGTYAGEVRLQGMSEPVRLHVTPHDFSERNAQVLEFNSVQYVLLDGRGGVLREGDAPIRGTISLPDLEVKLESLGNLEGGDDLVKADTFKGKLAGDLQSGEADWTTGLSQKGHLSVKAVK